MTSQTDEALVEAIVRTGEKLRDEPQAYKRAVIRMTIDALRAHDEARGMVRVPRDFIDGAFMMRSVVEEIGVREMVHGWGEPRHDARLGWKPTGLNVGQAYRLFDGGAMLSASREGE